MITWEQWSAFATRAPATAFVFGIAVLVLVVGALLTLADGPDWIV